MRYILADILYGIDPKKCPNSLLNLIIPDVHYSNYYCRIGKSAIFKSHHLPRPEMKKVIHLVRDGRDVITSYYNMLKNQGYDFSLEEVIMQDKGVYPTDWSTHCAAWLNNPYEAEIFTIRYEELKAEPTSHLKRLCEFLDLKVDDAVIMQTINKTNFDNLQRKEQETGELSKSMKNGLFFRRGETGSYKDELSHDQIILFETRHDHILHMLGYL